MLELFLEPSYGSSSPPSRSPLSRTPASISPVGTDATAHRPASAHTAGDNLKRARDRQDPPTPQKPDMGERAEGPADDWAAPPVSPSSIERA